MAIRTYQQFTPQLGERVFVDASAVVLGDVEIGADSSVWPLVVIRGDMHSIRIGERSSIQDGSVLHITHAGPFNPRGYPLNIGDDVTIGHNVTLHGCNIGSRVRTSSSCEMRVVEVEQLIAAIALRCASNTGTATETMP